MIGKLSGRLDWRGTDHVLIDVRGVGYIVYVSDRVLAAMPRVGEAVSLYTDLMVREDLLQLFGFPTLMEKEWHRLLLSVQGVGAKASLAILGTLGPEGVGRAIALGDWSSVARARGIGPKTAQRVVNELKDKAPGLMAMGGTLAAAQGTVVAAPGAAGDDDAVIEAPLPAPAPATPAQSSIEAEALSALLNLGYGPGDATGAVAKAAEATPGADTAVLIRAALRLLAPKG